MINAFCALRYDLARAGSLDSLVTEPYDKITDELKAKYLAANPYNVVRLIRGESGPHDDGWHGAAAQLWRTWRSEGIVLRESKRSFGVLTQEFRRPDGPSATRTCIVGAFDLDQRGNVLHHEKTHAKPKNDRRRLLDVTGVPFGLVFLLRHKGPRLGVDPRSGAETFGSARDGDGTQHTWAFQRDPAIIASIEKTFAESRYVIADGHHRFTVASEYADSHPSEKERRRVLVAVVEVDDPGLVILPTHRVISGLPDERRNGLIPLLQSLGGRPMPTSADPSAFLSAVRTAGRGTVGVMSRAGAFVWKMGDAGAPDDVTALDTHRLDRGFIQPLLTGLDVEEKLSYRRSAVDAVEDVRTRGKDLAFILNPVTPDIVCAVAEKGGVMPQKSTDFFPKMLDGFLFYDGGEKGLLG